MLSNNIVDANTKEACEAKSTPQFTYKWAIPFDTYDVSASKDVAECLVMPPAVQCEQAPWSRYMSFFNITNIS